METNRIPGHDVFDNPAGCCPPFYPDGWDDHALYFDEKLFVRATSPGAFHIPVGMAPTFRSPCAAIETPDTESHESIILGPEDSPWGAEHLFAVDREIPGSDMVRLSGDYLARVFEGSFPLFRKWSQDMKRVAAERGRRLEKLYFFHTTCPKCARVYGKNYVVGLAKVGQACVRGSEGADGDAQDAQPS